ncbi:MAG: cation:proton antiporter [Leptospiraceae bacterium]|nr:cation:proton antiporter [Leptospiraceae bacterium]
MKPRNLYLTILAIFIVCIILVYNKSLELFPNNHGLGIFFNLNTDSKGFFIAIEHSINDSIGKLLLQILVILCTAKALSYLLSYFKSPSVIGEMISGLLLGPSFLGLFFPEFYQFLFPESSLITLKLLSQIGLILFMFLIGLETNWNNLHGKLHSAIVISHASIIVPFILGIFLSVYLFEELSPNHVNFLGFSLFIGIAMSITAFPVLARIIQEKNLMNERSGLLAITSAAADDVTAWLLLALIIGITASTSVVSVLLNLLSIVIFLVLSFTIVRKTFLTTFQKYLDYKFLPKFLFFSILIWLTFSSLFTEMMGIHSLFGAFVAGTVLSPHLKIRERIFLRLEDFSTVYLLPIFFAYSGLKTEIGLLNSFHLILLTGLIISVAILGKFGGSFLTARLLGESWKDSLIIGVLMNTRGLMELVILNIGYELGFIGAELFTMMVIMALVTTFMTSPLISLIQKIFQPKEVNFDKSSNLKDPKILISFARPSTGINLTKLVFSLFPNSMIECFHVNQNFNFDIEKGQNEMAVLYENLRLISENENKNIEFKYSLSEYFETALYDEIKTYQPDLLLFGSSSQENWKEIYNQIPKRFLSNPDFNLAVFVGELRDTIPKFYFDKKDTKLVSILKEWNFNFNHMQEINLDLGILSEESIILKSFHESEELILGKGNYLILVSQK